MKPPTTGRRKYRSRWRHLLIALAYLSLLWWATRHFPESPVRAGDQGEGSDSSKTVATPAPGQTRGSGRTARGTLVTRAAKGKVPNPAAHADWGFLIVENLTGNPQPGDLAYLARLGPGQGLMKVEAVDGDKVILSLDTLDRALIRDQDRIETMPPPTIRSAE